MQLYALESSRQPILAQEAMKERLYLCPECLSSVRARSGPHRQAHFYHLKERQNCRQNKKSLAHLHLQLYLKELFPAITLEHSFPEIGRIADAFLEEKRVVFEVQCSPISAEEAALRCLDYAKQGLKLVWLLHDKRFNQKALGAAELFLRTQVPCYFVRLENRKTLVYDQYEQLKGAKRNFCGPPLTVDLEKIQDPPEKWPRAVMARKNWNICFQGDLTDRLIKGGSKSAEGIERLEKAFTLPKKASTYSLILNYILSGL